MKKKQKKVLGSMLKALSLGMGILFLYITTIQALHKHTDSSAHHEAGDSREYVQHKDTCPVCDFLSHQHNKEFYIPAAFILRAPVTKPVTLLSRSYAGIYKVTLQGFTNKGPPAVFCTTLSAL